MPKSIHLTGRGGSPKTMDLKRLNHLKNNLIEFKKIKKSFSYDSISIPTPVPQEPDPTKITVIKLKNSQRTNNVRYFDTTVDAADYLLSGKSTDRYEVIYGDECGIDRINMEYRTSYPTGGSDVGFEGKDVIEKLYVGTSVKSIGNHQNGYYETPFQDSVITTLTFAPDSVHAIYPFAFSLCDALTSITFPKTSLEYIGKSAFEQCHALASIHIPASVASMGDHAFYEGPYGGITTLTFESGGHLMEIPERAFGNRNFESLTIPGFIKSVGNQAFYVDFAGGVADVTYEDLTAGAKSITIEDGVLNIGGLAFSHHGKLRSLDLGNTVTTIGGQAFSASVELFTLEIPASVTTLGTNAFEALGSNYYEHPGTTIQITVHKAEGSLDLTSAGINNTTAEYVNITWDE